ERGEVEGRRPVPRRGRPALGEVVAQREAGQVLEHHRPAGVGPAEREGADDPRVLEAPGDRELALELGDVPRLRRAQDLEDHGHFSAPGTGVRGRGPGRGMGGRSPLRGARVWGRSPHRDSAVDDRAIAVVELFDDAVAGDYDHAFTLSPSIVSCAMLTW